MELVSGFIIFKTKPGKQECMRKCYDAIKLKEKYMSL